MRRVSFDFGATFVDLSGDDIDDFVSMSDRRKSDDADEDDDLVVPMVDTDHRLSKLTLNLVFDPSEFKEDEEPQNHW
jgi:hypothetical protein